MSAHREPQRRLRDSSDKMKTTWKEIAPVPSSQEFLDIVLSRTQRRLPTQIRSGFKISRIRSEHDSVLRIQLHYQGS